MSIQGAADERFRQIEQRLDELEGGKAQQAKPKDAAQSGDKPARAAEGASKTST